MKSRSVPTSQDAETPSHSGFNLPHFLYLTDEASFTSEFRRSEMWAQNMVASKFNQEHANLTMSGGKIKTGEITTT
jgi:hypothetical protein